MIGVVRFGFYDGGILWFGCPGTGLEQWIGYFWWWVSAGFLLYLSFCEVFFILFFLMGFERLQRRWCMEERGWVREMGDVEVLSGGWAAGTVVGFNWRDKG